MIKTTEEITSLLIANSRQALKHTMEVPVTPLIGREQDVHTICKLIQSSNTRLLALTGTGGIGKTRLAIQVAGKLADAFQDGFCFVPLAPISHPDLVIPTIARVCG